MSDLKHKTRQVSRLLLVCLLLQSCGSAVATGGGAPAGQSPSSDSTQPLASPTPSEGPGGSPEDPATAWNLQQSSIDACMESAGLEYRPSFLEPGTETVGESIRLFEPVGGRSEERLAGASANGFGMYDWYTGYQAPVETDPSAGEPNDAVIAGLASHERDEYMLALGECVKSAETNHPMPPSPIDPGAGQRLEELTIEILDALNVHPDVAAALDEYETCMAGSGFPLAGQPIQSFLEAEFEAVVGVPYHEGMEAFRALTDVQRDELIEQERAAAVADVECAIPVEETWNRVGLELEAEYLANHPELG